MAVVDTDRALATVRDEARACEQARRLTAKAVEALRSTRVFEMTMGRRLGGPELDPITQLEVLEAISAADASAGWCAMIGSDGGYAVNGRWAFGSGSTHSEWLFLHAMATDPDGSMRFAESGIPEMVMVAVPAADVVVHDTWYTTGLAGSGSHDIAVTDVFVPRERTFSLLSGTPHDPSPLYRPRWMFFINIGAVPLGLGRAAVDEAIRVADGKFDMASMTTAADDPLVAMSIARAEALVASARAYLFDTVGAVWDAAQNDGDLTQPWARFRLATTNAFHSAKDSIGILYESLGTSGVYASSLLDRHYRDIATMTQHVLAQPKTWTPAGRVLLGRDPQQLVGF